MAAQMRLCLAGVLMCWVAACAVALPTGFVNEQLYAGIDEPMQMELLPDGRFILLQRGGLLKILDADGGGMATYLKLPKVMLGGEKGAISIILDDDFPARPHFFVYWVPDSDKRFRVSRFTHRELSGGLSSRSSLSSEFVVWKSISTVFRSTQPTVENKNHWGGAMGFALDGMLWLALGDATEPKRADNLDNDFSKLVRINPRTRYAGAQSAPADNWRAGTRNPWVHAMGFRNAFRGYWDRATDRFLVAEVGGNTQVTAHEDIHVANQGMRHHGWPACEGDCNNPTFQQTCSCAEHSSPYWTFAHKGKNSALIGGFIYQPTGNFPDEYHGSYWWGDYPRNEVRSLMMAFNGNTPTTTVRENRLIDKVAFGQGLGTTSLIQGKDGAVYFTLLNRRSSFSGQIRRIRYTLAPENEAPTIATVTATPAFGAVAPHAVKFGVTASDADGDDLSYQWEFGDGKASTKKNPSHTYLTAGAFKASVIVSDGSDSIRSDQLTVTVGSDPEVKVVQPVAGTFQAGDVISYSGTSNAASCWYINFKHDNHFHAEQTCVPNGTMTVANAGHSWSGDTSLVFRLESTISGKTAEEEVTLLPEKSNLLLGSEPTGISLQVDGIPKPSPSSYDTLVGFSHAVTAPKWACVGNELFKFHKWKGIKGSKRKRTTLFLSAGASDKVVNAKYKGQQGCGTGTCQSDGTSGKCLPALSPPPPPSLPAGQCLLETDNCKGNLDGCCDGLICRKKKARGKKVYLCVTPDKCNAAGLRCKWSKECCSFACKSRTCLPF